MVPRVVKGEAWPPAELWLVDLATAGPVLEEVERSQPRLSSVDLEKIESISSEDLRRERRATYIALRILLERTFGMEIRTVPYAYSDSGKPYLPATAGGFSLSHAPGYALIGISRCGEIGVDIEAPRDPKITDERRERTERVAAALVPDTPLPSEPQTRLLQAWVRLEALAKAEGCGLARLLTRYGILGPRQDAAADKAIAADGRAIRVADLKFERQLVGAMAFTGRCSEISPAMFPADRASIAALLAGKHTFGR